MKREIREKRNELRETSKRLKELAWNCDFAQEKNFQLREKQDILYKKFVFYNQMIKAEERISKNV